VVRLIDGLMNWVMTILLSSSVRWAFVLCVLREGCEGGSEVRLTHDAS
jgi:hypothetical protein